jgi:hypothetical protein
MTTALESEAPVYMKKSINNQDTPLACAVCARLALRWRVAVEHESGEAARVDQNLQYASLQESKTLLALSTELRHNTAEALNDFRTHRATHIR